LTIDRVEAGRPCRLDTKRKILLALGLKVSDKDRVFDRSGESGRRAAMDSPTPASQETPRETTHGSGDATHGGLSAGAGPSQLRGPWRQGR
jgi:hypothetical protein